MSANVSLLIADDEVAFAQMLGQRFSRQGFEVTVVHSGTEALAVLSERDFDVALLDQRLPDLDGLDVLHAAKEVDQDLEIVMLTGYGNIESAIEAVRSGAYDYLTKPCNSTKLELTLRKAVEKRRLAEQAAGLPEALRRQSGDEPIIGQSAAIRRVTDLIRRVADSEASVLILGESGTGKELVARSLHFWSGRRDQPFQALNSAALPPQLLETELFGHEKGAFTGAGGAKQGLVEVADGGSLFLDEIGDMDIGVQAKFLRFLETGEFRRVGSTRLRQVKVRVAAATNRNLAQEVQDGRFREDLYYRLNVVTIEIPPLRDRKEDIPLLSTYLLKKKTGTRSGIELSSAAVIALQNYDFPGNVRELANMIERGVLLAHGPLIEPYHLFYSTDKGMRHPFERERVEMEEDLSFAGMEKRHILKVLGMCTGNKTQAARILGIGLRTLYRKLEEYGL